MQKSKPYKPSVVWRDVFETSRRNWKKLFIATNLIYLLAIGFVVRGWVNEYKKEIQIIKLTEQCDEFKIRYEILGILRLKGLSLSQGMDIADITIKQCKDLNIPIELPLAVMKKETGFVNSAVSHAGAMGIMQLMPATFEIYNKALRLGLTRQAAFDPIVNIRIATHYIKDLLDEFKPKTKTEQELWKKVLTQYSGGASGYPESIKKFSKEYKAQLTPAIVN